ncbi:Cysteine-rich secretory protein family protein [Maritimibacter sp. HL-12]|nr:Cysteine-rich secretory protein family protein [Maritimibacter sp. HL-12]
MKALALAALLAVGAPAAACELPDNAARLMADAGATMNAERKAAGRKALIRDARLDKAAQSHACWMAETDTFSHKGAGGSLPKRRITATGYRPMLTAENIAFGQSSGARVIAEWMESSGHRENILRRGVVEYGVGVALMQGRPVWVMVYADK